MKRITQQDLQSLYGPAPEEFENRIHAFLSGLPEKEEKCNVKKKASLAFVLAAVLVLAMVATAAAGLIDWNVVVGLYGREKPDVKELMESVNQSAVTQSTKLSISSALTDGKALIFDWTLEMEEDTLPLFVSTKDLRVNGEKHMAGWGDGLQWLWLRPGETIRQGTEIVEMDKALQPGEKVHVELTLKISRPRQPVTLFDSHEDRTAAAQLRAEGIRAVAPYGIWNSNRFDEDNKQPYQVPFWLHYQREGFSDEEFEHEEMLLQFDVTVPETEKMAVYPACEKIELKECTAYLREAYRTPIGVYTKVELISHETADEEGNLAQSLNEYSTSLLLQVGNSSFSVNHSFRSEMVWIGEDGKVHQMKEANMIGYQDALLQEGSKVVISLERIVEYPLAESTHPANYYTPDGRFPIYFEER